MNCRRIQEIIPLYVGGDLERKREEVVSAHLRSCPGCSSVADQYIESVEWLQSYRPPEFGSDFFDDLKRGVLGQIRQKEWRPPFFQALAAWGKRNAVFAAVALLVVVGSLVFYAYQRGLIERPAEERFAADQQAEPAAPPQERVIAPTQERKRVGVQRRRPRRATFKEAIALMEPIKHGWENEFPPVSQREESESEIPTSLEENQQSEEIAVPADRTRIELQTSDPNIRIIWFIPTDAAKLSNRRATDT